MKAYVVRYNEITMSINLLVTTDYEKAEKYVKDCDKNVNISIDEFELDVIPSPIKTYWWGLLCSDDDFNKAIDPLLVNNARDIGIQEDIVKYYEETDYFNIELYLSANKYSKEKAEELIKLAFNTYLHKYKDIKPKEVKLEDLIASANSTRVEELLQKGTNRDAM